MCSVVMGSYTAVLLVVRPFCCLPLGIPSPVRPRVVLVASSAPCQVTPAGGGGRLQAELCLVQEQRDDALAREAAAQDGKRMLVEQQRALTRRVDALDDPDFVAPLRPDLARRPRV